MAAPSVPVFLLQPLSPRIVTSSLPLPYSRSSTTREKEKRQACPIRGSVYRFEQPPVGSRHSLVRAKAKDRSEACRDGSLRQMDINRRIELGRCALLSAAAAFVIQCGYGDESAIAALYSPSVVGSTDSSISVGKSDKWTVAAPKIFNSIVMKKSRTDGSHAKLNILADGLANQSAAGVGVRKPVLSMKRTGANLPRLRSSSVATQVACSSIGPGPLATISAASLTTSFGGLSRLSLALDSAVLRSSIATSLNLLTLCSLVVWMQRSGQLPADTPVILSQVAFKLFIPCFLLSKVATTLSASSASNLVALPLMAVAQVIVGAALGNVASKVFFRAPSLQPAVDWSGNETGDSSSSSLAFTLQQQRLSRTAAVKKQALITAACAFGNSLTLPLVFLTGVLGATEDVNRAAGYLALYMVGWSPAMWSVGLKIITAGDEKEELQSSNEGVTVQSVLKWVGEVMNPPLYGVLVGLLIGGTPLSHFFLGGGEAAASGSPSLAIDAVGILPKLRALTAGVLSPLLEAASLLGSATLAVQTVVLATSLGAILPKPGEKSVKLQVLGEGETGSPSSESILDRKAFWVISLVRLILLPITGILMSFVLQCYHMLPPDPVYRLVILAESAMPTAQNLVLLAQLNAGTRPLAGMLARLLLGQYALSVIPITIWMAIFLTLT